MILLEDRIEILYVRATSVPLPSLRIFTIRTFFRFFFFEACDYGSFFFFFFAREALCAKVLSKLMIGFGVPGNVHFFSLSFYVSSSIFEPCQCSLSCGTLFSPPLHFLTFFVYFYSKLTGLLFQY